MIEVEIKNFQAIDDLKLEIEGFTALVGRSNIGKSSVVRALRCALSGSSGSDFVRHDARSCPRLQGAKTCKCFASVKLSFADGNALLWEKGGRGVNRYTVWRAGEKCVYDRVGQHVDLPDFMESSLSPVKLADSLLQVSSQFEAPFLLNLSGPAVASILSDIGQLDEINQALAAVAKDRRAAVATRKVRERDVEAVTARIATYANLDAHVERVEAVQRSAQACNEVQGRVQLAARFITQVAEAAASLRRLAAVAEAKPPGIDGLLEAAKRAQRAASLISEFDSRARQLVSLKAALGPALPDGEALGALRTRWSLAVKLERVWRAQQTVAGRLTRVTSTPVPGFIGDVRKRASDVARLAGWIGKVVPLEEAHARGSLLEATPVPEPTPLRAGLRRLQDATRLLHRLDRLERESAEAERMFETNAEELRLVSREFAALGVCPTCHQGISSEHVRHAS